MIAPNDAHAIFHASLYFNELFKKTVLATPVPEVSTKTKMDLMVTLLLNGPMNMSALSKRTGIAPEQTTRAIRDLREAGFVESERDEANRRMVVAHLSDKGESLMKEHEQQLFRSLESSLEGLSDEEIAQLADCARQTSVLFGKAGFQAP